MQFVSFIILIITNLVKSFPVTLKLEYSQENLLKFSN